MRYLFIWFTAAAILAVQAAPAASHFGGRWRGAVDVDIVADSGGAFRSVPFRDDRSGGSRVIKRYIEAREGESYAVLVRNGTGERIGLVIAVDGRNIISGDRSELAGTEPMYIVNAGDSGRFDGWRTSSAEVHRFLFTDAPGAYALRTFNDSSALGVIAVAVFREKERPRPQKGLLMRREAPSPGAGSDGRSESPAAADRSAGTGFGEAHFSPVVPVKFEPQRMPVQKTLIRYEWRDGLCRMGVLRCDGSTGRRLWDENSFAPHPPGSEGR